MPFIEDKNASFFERSQGMDDIPVEEKPVTFQEEMTAAFRLENTLGSFMARDPNMPDRIKTTDFDAWGEMTEQERLNSQFTESAVGADNMVELEGVRRQFARENKDRETLKNSYLAPFLMGVSDPINLMPVGGVAYQTYKAGGSILKNAVATGSVAAGSTALTESALHHTQITRTMTESAANMAAATFLGGILGAAPGTVEKLITRSGRNPKDVFDEIDLVMDPERAIADGGNPTMFDRSIGAAQVDNDAQVRGRLAKAATKFLGFDPWSATATSEAKATRSTVNALAESPLDMDKPLGQAVETSIKLHDGKFFEAVDGHMTTFKAFKAGGGELNRREFAEAVGKAVRNGSDDPMIQKAADIWNAKLYDPLKKEFIDQGLLPKDVDVTTAAGYLNRIWNKQKIASNLSGFIEKTKGWLDEQNVKKLAVQNDIEKLSTDMVQSQTKARRLRNNLDTSSQRLAKAEKQLEEVRRAEKASIERAFKTKARFKKGEKARLQLAELEVEARIAKRNETIDLVTEDFGKVVDGERGKLNDSKARTVVKLEKQVEKLNKSETIGKLVAKAGGLSREAFKAEGIDPASFKDRGKVFGKPLWPKEGGMTPDDLAEALNQERFLGGELQANEVISIVDDITSGKDPFLDGTINAEIDFIIKKIDDIEGITDQTGVRNFLDNIKQIDIEEEVRIQQALEDQRFAEQIDAAPVDAQGGAIAPAEKIGAATTEVSKSGLTGRRGELGIAEARQRKRSNELQDRISGLKHSIDDLNTNIKRLDDDALARVNDLEARVSDWPGKAANDVRRTIRGRDSVAATKASKELLVAIRKLNKVDLDVVDTEDLAGEIAGRIMGTPDGRLPYDYQIGENSTGGVSDSLSGPFKRRSFVIPDELMEEFLENDIEVLGARYIKATAPDLELTRRFGDVEMKNELKDIEREWIEKIKAEKDPKKARALERQKDKDIKNIAAMRDRLRGRFGQVDHNNPWVRAARVARDLNYMRLLGGVVASSIPDIARIIAAEGLGKAFSNGLLPLVAKNSAFKISAREAKLWGVGTDALMGGRAEIYADVADYSAGGNAFERGVRSAATKFSSINLMNQWTGGMKQLHAVAMQTRVIPELRAGKIDRRLNQLGIDDANAKNISIELKNHAEEIDGVWIANTRSWENQELAMMWAGAVRKESDRVIIIPGQEKPLFMSTELGKTVGQFKTFLFSATQRILISNLQRQDSHYIQGVVSMLTLGMMAYAFKNWDAGRELSDDPAVWVAEGIDRSGMIGILMEANNTIEKISQNSMGIRPMLGINAPASRYASRSILDSMAGPTFGLMGTVAQVAGGISGQRDWDKSDTRALRRLLPGQNLSILRQGLDKIEEAAQ